MKPTYRKIMREQIQADLDDLNSLAKKSKPKGGWIEIIRKALGMSGRQLAERMGRAQSNIVAFEHREKTKKITLEALEKAAKAMNCQLVYYFVPDKPLDQILKDQARFVAQKRLRAISHSMELEQQGLSQQQKKQQEDDLVQELLQGSERKLWDEEDEI